MPDTILKDAKGWVVAIFESAGYALLPEDEAITLGLNRIGRDVEVALVPNEETGDGIQSNEVHAYPAVV